MANSKLPPVYPHGDLQEVFPDIFFVTGSLAMAGAMPVRFSRNMIVVREGESLTVINSMRLNEDGLAALDALGTVKHVIRLAGFHGMDDPFFKDRYDATVWVVKGHVYSKGIDLPEGTPEDGYFQPDVYMDADTELPLAKASLIRFDCQAGEGILHLHREGGILVTGDSLQNWQSTEYFNWLAKIMMRLLGFIKPHNLGPGWVKMAKPDTGELKALLDLDFAHVLPAHGLPVVGDAREKYRPVIEKLK